MILSRPGGRAGEVLLRRSDAPDAPVVRVLLGLAPEDGAIQYNTIQYNTIQYNTVRY